MRSSSVLLLIGAVPLLGCAHTKKSADETPVKKEWNNVHFGPAKYDRYTGGFEDPWPFGPGP
ncbi:MAG: hypothetical protein WB696_18520 [Chthoniobacterales bacterium]|jgi:hypothetical protein